MRCGERRESLDRVNEVAEVGAFGDVVNVGCVFTLTGDPRGLIGRRRVSRA
jgi:hypothetical protein